MGELGHSSGRNGDGAGASSAGSCVSQPTRPSRHFDSLGLAALAQRQRHNDSTRADRWIRHERIRKHIGARPHCTTRHCTALHSLTHSAAPLFCPVCCRSHSHSAARAGQHSLPLQLHTASHSTSNLHLSHQEPTAIRCARRSTAGPPTPQATAPAPALSFKSRAAGLPLCHCSSVRRDGVLRLLSAVGLAAAHGDGR